MCSHPIRIPNPSKWISLERGQQAFLFVPCNHCLECRQRIQNEWRVRSYYHCVETIMNGGYMLFDTLTYSNQYLPRLSDFTDVPRNLDFSCFRTSDLQLFMKRLRTNLMRYYSFDPSSKLTYFITCEYGKRNTRRPHYHIFFFVKDKSLSPLSLSRCVSQSWSYGRTDGLPYKTQSYVNLHNTFDSLDLSVKKCVLYVAKYVSKDFLYDDMVKSRLYRLMDYYTGDPEWQISKVHRKRYQFLQRFVSPFHLQSVRFGDFYITALGKDNLIRDGYLKITGSNGLPFVLSLFPSLKRKLFYDRIVDDDGDIGFRLNSLGVDFKVRSAFRLVTSLQRSISSYNLCHSEKLSFDPFDFLFNHYRLQSFPVTDLRTQVALSSSCDSSNSLRNYSSVDKGLVHQRVFARRSFGSRKHGFDLVPIANFVDDIVDVRDDFDFLRFDSLSRYYLFYSDVDNQYMSLLDWKASEGRKAMSTARLRHRLDIVLSPIIKSKMLC